MDMEYEDGTRTQDFLTGLLLGAAIGACVALMAAPQSGNRTRRKIKRVAGSLTEGAHDRIDDFAEDVKARVDDAVKGARKRITR
jgi:gas vesicle protein